MRSKITSLMRILAFLLVSFAVVALIPAGLAEEDETSSDSDYRNEHEGGTVNEVNVAVAVPGKKSSSSSTSRALVVSISVAAVVISVAGIGVSCRYGYKRWQRKKREAQQARLMKLFEPDDQLDEELSGNNIL